MKNNIKMWIEYRAGAFEWEFLQIFKGTKEQILHYFKNEFDDEDLTYELLMDSDTQDEYEFRLEELPDDSIINLDVES